MVTKDNNPMQSEIIDHFFKVVMDNVKSLTKLLNPNNFTNEVDLTEAIKKSDELQEDLLIIKTEIKELENRILADENLQSDLNKSYISFLWDNFYKLFEKHYFLLYMLCCYLTGDLTNEKKVAMLKSLGAVNNGY